MEISHVIIHELQKETKKMGATLTIADSTIDSKDERVVNLITELNNRYRFRSETYGVFDKKNPTDFHTTFEAYDKSRTEKDFVKFSQQSSRDLQSRIDSNAPAKGGFLIFVHYEAMRKYVGIFLVRNTIGMSFSLNKGTKKFDITNVPHIDFENLAMACRINLEALKKKDTHYLSFINKQTDEMAQYFIRWVSSIDNKTNESDTKSLYELLKNVPVPKDRETGHKMDRDDFLESVYREISAIPGKLINIRSLSQAFYDDANYLQEYIEDNDLDINGEFKAHSKSLKKFIQVRAKADSVELVFPHSAYKTIVNFNPNNKKQIIIESAELVAQIRQSLNN